MPDLNAEHETAHAGLPFYGSVAGIIMLDSTTPRVPGDPGHAATFPFPVHYEIARGFKVDQLVEYDPACLGPVVEAAKRLEALGVNFVATDCGLFSLYQSEIAGFLSVPFLSSSLVCIPLLLATLNPASKVGILTGHTGYLRDAHLRACAIDTSRVAIMGMEGYKEFRSSVLEGGATLNARAISEEVVDAAGRLLQRDPTIRALVLECTNLSVARRELLSNYGLPVFDLVGAVELFAESVRMRRFGSDFVPFRPLIERAPAQQK